MNGKDLGQQTLRIAACRVEWLSCHVLDHGPGVAGLTFSPEGLLRACERLGQRFPGIRFHRDPDLQQQVEQVLGRFLQGDSPFSDIPVSPLLLEAGTPFQQWVWQHIASIPPGMTRTYGDLARAMGRPGSARAVGQACNANPLALVIPCHRVVGAGSLGGFAGGGALKESLLQLERAFYQPVSGVSSSSSAGS